MNTQQSAILPKTHQEPQPDLAAEPTAPAAPAPNALRSARSVLRSPLAVPPSSGSGDRVNWTWLGSGGGPGWRSRWTGGRNQVVFVGVTSPPVQTGEVQVGSCLWQTLNFQTGGQVGGFGATSWQHGRLILLLGLLILQNACLSGAVTCLARGDLFLAGNFHERFVLEVPEVLVAGGGAVKVSRIRNNSDRPAAAVFGCIP